MNGKYCFGPPTCVLLVLSLMTSALHAQASPPFTILHSFSTLSNVSSGTNMDGAFPYGGLIRGKGGTLYGTASGGGAYGNGTVFDLTMAPFIRLFSPSRGPVGTAITLKGAYFTETTNVQFGNVYVAFKVNSDTSLTLTVPAGATSARITVYDPSGKDTSSTAFKVTH